MTSPAEIRSERPEPCPPGFNLAAYVLQHAQRTPDKTALVEIAQDLSTQSMSYETLERIVLATATGLHAAGVRKGDRLVLRLGNSLHFPVAFLASIALGAVPVPTSAALTEREFLGCLGQLSDVAAVICDRELIPKDCPQQIIPADYLSAMQDNPPCKIAPSQGDDPAYIIFTSGSSGVPKAVVHAHRAVWARRMMWRDWYALSPTDRVLHAGALNWTYTLGTGLMDPWAIGATAFVFAGKPAPTLWPHLIAAHDITIFAGAPGVFRQILRLDELPAMPKLRHALSAGERLPQSVAEDWRARSGKPILTALGMSECSTYISARPDGTPPCPQSGRRVAILREDGQIAPRQETGQLAVHQSDQGLMLGYLQSAGDVVLPLTGEWFITGDLAQMGPDGTISHQGRADDLITAGGFRIAPQEIEQALGDYPGITEAAATGIATKSGAIIVAAFYTGPSAIDEPRIKAYMAERLANYKCPRAYLRLEDFPRRANGKLDRKALSKWTLP